MQEINVGSGVGKPGGTTTNAGSENLQPNTISTPQGPIKWTQGSDGAINAEGGGQTLIASGHSNADGSWQSSAVYTQTSQSPYLTMRLAASPAGPEASVALVSGASQLTLTVSGINALATSGTATLSGSWNGAPANWTGHADLTTNPLATNPIAGWPKGAFASQLQTAAFFAPLGNQLARQIAAESAKIEIGKSPGGGLATGGLIRKTTATGVIGRAVSWCIGSAIGAMVTGTGEATFGIGAVLACVGGASASVASDAVTAMADDNDVPIDPPPDPNPPPDPDPTDDGTATQTSQDGNSTGPDEGDGGGGGCFVAGTPVHAGDGSRVPIERIDVESKLLSCDTEAEKISMGTVTRLFKATSAEIVTIVFGEEKLRCTPRHRFFSDSGWLAARHLSPGIKVRSLDGEMRPILAISIEPAETPVFNMRVDSQHTYFVGETGYLVHNEKDTDQDDGNDDPGNTEDKKNLGAKTRPVTPPTTMPNKT
jgi:hypothetical protein